MPHYQFNTISNGILYEMKLYAKNFRADSSGKVGFFDYSGDLIRMFDADEIIIDSIRKIGMEEKSGEA